MRPSPRTATTVRRWKTILYLRADFRRRSGRPRIVRAGTFLSRAYGSDIEFVCLDTSKEGFFKGHRLFEFPKHSEFVETSFPRYGGSPLWRIPFAHHPPYSAGPQHHNTKEMARLIPLFQRSGVKVIFSGHEHNFQHSRADGIDYVVTGAAGKFRAGTPDVFAAAHTLSWSAQCHFVLARIEGDQMTVRAIGELQPGTAGLADIVRQRPDGEPVTGPIHIRG